ncbi:MAG: DUF5606 family protein [Flavobacteriales bacterium]|jgi:hypothetical protein|nr:DUF5606 domain-containing protein [Flavobacteriaceae bacterium]MDO7582105.1 DUF5606 domain-containing protein [Flavobacteriaceae bacterium]MDO7592372.1 DUF5606 domain-containing protein [Flavobacteriaceae bacterium]MDO7599292.1 DUF5606 domain-containing protein [Flavobacteriaceae bacterium]MDO7603398.1 DUF5606 domain-containing protein [Flavobacteriaceae bacterium]|tara:strand:+ start:7459 stop:7908 length:450 start_codon:yes stop_codon:yes gene_type:complete
MELDKIIAISGRPGLFEVQVQTRTGFVAHSLVDGKRITASIRDQVSLLSEINIYGLQDEVPLAEIFQKILAKENGAVCSVKPKAPATDLEAFFFEVFQDYDEERVYPSDIKKIIQWYNVLVNKGLLVAEAAPAAESEAPTEEATPTEEA